MEFITVHTTQNIGIDYEIGGLGERIVARIIDYAIFIPFLIVGAIMASGLSSTGLGIYFIALFAIFIFYDLLCEVFFNGQSFGKKVMKIRVISLDGRRPKFSQYLLRWLFRLVDFAITGSLGALIAAIATKDGQRIGDIVAGTALIKTHARTTQDNIIYAPTNDAYQPVFTQVTQLRDSDISLIHEVMENYYKTGNSVLVYNLADRIRAHLAISMPANMDSLVFLQTILKDYSHINSASDLLINS